MGWCRGGSEEGKNGLAAVDVDFDGVVAGLVKDKAPSLPIVGKLALMDSAVNGDGVGLHHTSMSLPKAALLARAV